MQALQAVKIILQMPGILSGKFLMFDGMEMTFKKLKLRLKNPGCAICGTNPSIHTLIDYEEFCGAKANDKNPNLKILNADERINVFEFNEISKLSSKPYLIVDVRSNQEFEMCHLKNSINIPFTKIRSGSSLKTEMATLKKKMVTLKKEMATLKKEMDKAGPEMFESKKLFLTFQLHFNL